MAVLAIFTDNASPFHQGQNEHRPGRVTEQTAGWCRKTSAAPHVSIDNRQRIKPWIPPPGCLWSDEEFSAKCIVVLEEVLRREVQQQDNLVDVLERLDGKEFQSDVNQCDIPGWALSAYRHLCQLPLTPATCQSDNAPGTCRPDRLAANCLQRYRQLPAIAPPLTLTWHRHELSGLLLKAEEERQR